MLPSPSLLFSQAPHSSSSSCSSSSSSCCTLWTVGRGMGLSSSRMPAALVHEVCRSPVTTLQVKAFDCYGVCSKFSAPLVMAVIYIPPPCSSDVNFISNLLPGPAGVFFFWCCCCSPWMMHLGVSVLRCVVKLVIAAAHTPAACVVGPDLLCVNGPDTSMQSH